MDTSREALRIEKPIYGGDGLARAAEGEVVRLPFVLPGELVDVTGEPDATIQLLEPSKDRVRPRCVHFGVCGGCQYQMAKYSAQLAMKVAVLRETLDRAGVHVAQPLRVEGSPEAWGYRNRIRLRVQRVEGVLRLGYNQRGTREFLAISMCPIAAPVLWTTAEALMQVAANDRSAAEWLSTAAEVEIGCDELAEQVQVHLLCPGDVPRARSGLERLAEHVKGLGIKLVSAGASKLHVTSGRAMQTLAAWGADGLVYQAGDQRYWLERGSFFQVNRFLLPTLVKLVTTDWQGDLAWDLFAGVGLFARSLARSFARVTAVEASAVAVKELQRGLRRPEDKVVQQTTLAFLRQAVVQRDRPNLVVLDPPRAGVGEEVCRLLVQLEPSTIVYVSCDPTTLARDAAVLLGGGYGVTDLHMLDLFPQTYHLETVMVLKRVAVSG